MFKLDKKIPYEEFLRTITYHAENYEIEVTKPYQKYHIVQELIAKARDEERQQRYSQAYYFVRRCLFIFNRNQKSRDFIEKYPHAIAIYKEARDFAARLVSDKLPKEYKDSIDEIDRSEAERRRIVALQLEPDEYSGGNENFSWAADMHSTRQQKLLLSENNSVNELLQRLNHASIPDKQRTTSHGHPSGPLDSQPTSIATYPSELSPKLERPESPGSNTRSLTSCSPYTNCILNPTDAPLTKPRRGIVNLGNTCYMNSVLQVLNSTPLGQYFLTADYISHLVTTKGKLTHLTNAFCFVIRELNRVDCDYSVSTSQLKLTLGDYYEGFRNSSQQDANEFLRVVLDGIHGALNLNESNQTIFREIDNSKGTDEELAHHYWAQYCQRNSSVVVDYCSFQERSTILCPSCGHQSRSFNVCLSIEISIPSTQSKVSLDDCFAAYCREEILDDNSMYMCPNCHQKVNARKQMSFYSVPSVLFITLKRFRSYGSFTTASKVNSSVFFSKTLSVAPYMCSNFSKTEYHLVGIVNHQGNMHGGHYTADAVGVDGVWCNFSDERVTKVDVADNKQAYILCYVH
ncbi:hypothetical protein JKF63_03307 [Porcisia hertigi]|uniref:Ubiquitin carboxyl-terminal hydrolase n=1 Tax=Porcisia hertigi TaxID=2761500 RepID=A0A836IS17_9TRYP|nr:hypothetical protein JKF63_03307 [Porcisia hertigi]